MPIMVNTLQAYLSQLDDGVLRHGAHKPGREFCALEFVAQVRHLESDDEDSGVDTEYWTDRPETTRLPDLRPINDGPWSSDQARTIALLPVLAALWDWADWSPIRQQTWVEHVAIATVRDIIGQLGTLSESVRKRCQSVTTAASAASAARAASAASAAASAARAAYATAADTVLIQACKIWITAAHATRVL